MSKKRAIEINLAGSPILTAVFVVLKALGYISWSWWWVFAPLWLPWAIFLAVIVVIALFALLAAVIS